MKSISTVLLLLVAVGCSGDDPVGIDTDLLAFSRIGADNAVKMVPFTGRHSAMSDESIAPDCDTGTPLGTTIIEGNASHLGTFTGNSMGCTLGPSFLSSSFTWIGANGDEVWLSLDHTADQPFTFVFPEFVITLEYDITGGSGRFDGAEGHVVMVVTVILFSDVPNQATWEGTISSPGSIR